MNEKVALQAERMYGPGAKITQAQYDEAAYIAERMDFEERRDLEERKRQEEINMLTRNGTRQGWQSPHMNDGE